MAGLHKAQQVPGYLPSCYEYVNSLHSSIVLLDRRPWGYCMSRFVLLPTSKKPHNAKTNQKPKPRKPETQALNRNLEGILVTTIVYYEIYYTILYSTIQYYPDNI